MSSNTIVPGLRAGAGRSRARLAAGAAVAALLLTTGCSSDQSTEAEDPAAGAADAGTSASSGSAGSSGSAAAEPAFPATVTAANGEVTIEEMPERIVSLSPTATETLFAIGAGDQVVAVDDQSDYPQEAPRTKLSGFEPNLEAIIGYRPDLVVVSDGSPTDVTKGLEKAEVPVVAGPAATTFAEAYDQIVDLGQATGHTAEARALVQEMRTEITELVAAVPEGVDLSVFHELSPDLYSASSNTFIGQVYTRLGLTNVADEAAKESGTDYPQLSAEYVVSADPDLVLLADGQCCGVTPEKVAERPGWDQLSAVRRDAVVVVDEDIASRWGPRVPDFVEAVVQAIPEAADGDAAGATEPSES